MLAVLAHRSTDESSDARLVHGIGLSGGDLESKTPDLHSWCVHVRDAKVLQIYAGTDEQQVIAIAKDPPLSPLKRVEPVTFRGLSSARSSVTTQPPDDPISSR